MSTNEHWRALVGPWHHTLECLSAYKHLWPLMSAYEFSVGLMSTQVLNSKINTKMFLYAENENYPAIEINEDMKLEIFGVVTHAIHRFI